ncbi:MAG: hypothetical protein H7Y60_06490 [Rhodospirillaceae bacterium]|nr:hypothetical protein [Rhodospirillales bacterium]
MVWPILDRRHSRQPGWSSNFIIQFRVALDIRSLAVSLLSFMGTIDHG